MSRIVDLTLPVATGMAGIPKIPFYEQHPVKVQAVTVVNDEQRASLMREGVDLLVDAPATGSMNTVFTLNTHIGTHIDAIESRLEGYGSLGIEIMQRAYVLRRKNGELIFLFEDRAIATPFESSLFPKLAADITARAGVPLRDLGMVEGGGGLLAVWGARAPDWAAPALPLARQLWIWRHVAITGALAVLVPVIALIVRLLVGSQ